MQPAVRRLITGAAVMCIRGAAHSCSDCTHNAFLNDLPETKIKDNIID